MTKSPDPKVYSTEFAKLVPAFGGEVKVTISVASRASGILEASTLVMDSFRVMGKLLPVPATSLMPMASMIFPLWPAVKAIPLLEVLL